MTPGLWIPIGVSTLAALVSLVFGVTSWAVKRELERISKDQAETKSRLDKMEEKFLTLREFEKIEEMRTKQEQMKAEQDRRLEANLDRVVDILDELRQHQ